MENWSVIDNYQRCDHHVSIVKNYNLTYSFYKNVYSWGYQQAPVTSLQPCAEVTGALTTPAVNSQQVVNDTNTDNYNHSMHPQPQLGSNSSYITELQLYPTDNPPYLCARCRCGYVTNLFKLTTALRSVGFTRVIYNDDLGIGLLFWSVGKARKKLLKLYGFQCGVKYR